MITKPAKIPERNVVSTDIVKFDGGLYMGGAENAPQNSMTDAKDVELDNDGYIIPRRKLTKFLPDTINTSYQKFPVLWKGEIYYFTADNGKIRYCQSEDSAWTDCGGDNDFVTNNGGMAKFLRVLDNVLILNGKNGDKLSFVSLNDIGFPVVKYDAVSDPVLAPTDVLTGLASGSFNVYYAFNYSGSVGETKLSPILTVSVDHTRDEWSTMDTPGSVEITRTGTVPDGAKYWNIYMAIAATSGTIQDSDMLLLAAKQDLSTTKFIDNGTLAINLGSVAPIANSTDGPRVDQGEIVDGNPILYADQDNPYAIWIGGGGPYAMDFSISNGGYKAEPEKGTNFYPTRIIGFRTGQGQPALTVLYSNTEGLSKQAVLAQQTVNYGDSSFTVWGVTEQHYGAAGLAAPNSAINYNGRLVFLSTDGVMSMETQPSIQNVLSTLDVSNPVNNLIRSIKNSAMDKVIGAGWGNKYMWLLPSYGFDTPQEIGVLDANNKGVGGQGAWYTLKIAADWIGVVSPFDSPAFVYISQGNKTYKLSEISTTFDLVESVAKPFSTSATGPMLPVSGAAHNSWQAAVQAVFNVMDLIGTVEVGINYRNKNGSLKTKSKIYEGPASAPSQAGGWGDTQWTYAKLPQIPGWRAFPYIYESSTSLNAENARIKVRINDIVNEWQWFIRTEIGYNNYKLRAASLEGIGLGIKPDLQ